MNMRLNKTNQIWCANTAMTRPKNQKRSRILMQVDKYYATNQQVHEFTN